MLHYFTWQQFLIAALLFTLVWYAVVFLLYYRGKVTGLFAGKGNVRPTEKIKRDWEEDFDDEPENEEESLIGRQQLPEGVSELEMHMLGFAPKMEKKTPTEEQAPAETEAVHDEDEYRDTALGIVPDVLEELKSIFHILETQDGSKEDFISLFELVSSKYPKIRNTPNQEAINEYIRENLPFDISDEELDSLWV